LNLEATQAELNDTVLEFAGWTKHVLEDDEREMIDKSKLLLADAWATAETHTFKIAEGKAVLQELRALDTDNAQGTTAVARHQQAQDYASHFKEELRPLLFAWLASQHGINAEIERAKVELSSEASEENQRILNHFISRLQKRRERHAAAQDMLDKFVDSLRDTERKQDNYWYWLLVRPIARYRWFPKCCCRELRQAEDDTVRGTALHTVQSSAKFAGPLVDSVAGVGVDASSNLRGVGISRPGSPSGSE
jgi:hypothetical protein